MELQQAQQLALALMARHALLESGWRFAWSNARRQLGAAQICRRRDSRTGQVITTRTIKLSRHLVRLNDEAEVRETVLHEIAHAIAGVHNGHNKTWKDVCRRIGAKPERLAGENVRVLQPPYHLVCTCCRRIVARRYRRMRLGRLRRTYCTHCGPNSTGKLTFQCVPNEGHPIAQPS